MNELIKSFDTAARRIGARPGTEAYEKGWDCLTRSLTERPTEADTHHLSAGLFGCRKAMARQKIMLPYPPDLSVSADTGRIDMDDFVSSLPREEAEIANEILTDAAPSTKRTSRYYQKRFSMGRKLEAVR